DIDLAGNPSRCRRLVEPLAASEITHRSDNFEAFLGQLHCGQQADSAGGTGNQRNFFGRGHVMFCTTNGRAAEPPFNRPLAPLKRNSARSAALICKSPLSTRT